MIDEELMRELADLAQQQEKVEQQQAQTAEDYWNSFTSEQQMMLFYAVVTRLVQGELVDNGSYRYILYELFGFGPESYGLGMNCGFMDLHNSINRDVKKFT